MSGEYLALVLDCGGLDAFKKIEQGAPLARAIPRDFAKLSYYYLSIPKHAQHPNAAKVYVAYLLSAEGQKLVWDTWRTDLPSLPGSKSAAMIAKIEREQGVKFREFNVKWWNTHPEMRKAKKEMTNILVKSRRK